MPIDTGLLQQLRPLQVEPRENALMRALQMQGAMRQNQLAAMQYENAQRDNALAQEYRSALSQGADLNDPGTVKRLMSIDPVKTQAALAANEKLLGERATREMHQAQTKGITSENEQKAKLRVLEGLGGVRDVPGAYDWMANAVQSGLMTKENAIRHAQTLEQNPQALNDWIVGMQSSGAPLKDQIERRTPKRSLQDTGKALVPVDLNPVTNPNLGPLAKTTTYGEDLSAKTSTENNRRTVGASYANAAASRDMAQATRDAARIQTSFANESGLRKEFESLPEVKNYKQAYPAYAAIKDAASRNTTASDINIVYSIAKLYDPNSVVREGEYATVANSPNIPERIKGYAQFLAGGGKLTPKVKADLVAEATGRIATYKAEVDKAKGTYKGIAERRGIDPSNVFQDMGDVSGPSSGEWSIRPIGGK